MLLMMGKMYGDWRVIREKIDIMWKQYLLDHGMTESPRRRSYEQ